MRSRQAWNDPKGYMAWLSRRIGKTYRLLSEVEREYVTRAGTTMQLTHLVDALRHPRYMRCVTMSNPYRQTGAYAGRILMGAKPSDLPVMQSSKVEPIINAPTGRTLEACDCQPRLAHRQMEYSEHIGKIQLVP